jgi:para-nitrobenzyl esterase
MRLRFVLGFALLAATLAGCGNGGGSTTAPRGLIVATASGPVQGLEDDGVFSYRGIPYAAPPVGDLRWKPPVEPTSWTDTLATTENPNACAQRTFLGLPTPGFAPSEDCLYINVDTPAEGSDLPVMVWIHGGGFTVGEAVQADGGTSGDVITRETGVIVVSMNYRLGQFGFLAHSELTAESPNGASGNYGLMDQTAALKWVQDNIAAFGGDPDNVTIFGESAGAFSVCSHLASAASTGLFHKAIAQSGSCERPWAPLTTAEAQGDDFAEALGCGSEADVLGCMRAKPMNEVLAALPPGPNFGFNPSDEPAGSWGPILDGAFFTEQPTDSFASGNFNRVPTIVGFTREESRLFVWIGELENPPLEVTEDNYEALIAYFLGGNTELAAKVAMEYPLADYSEPAVAFAAVTTDAIFRCPGKQEVAKLAAFVPAAYLYQFEYPDGRSQLELAIQFGILPGGELPSYDLAAFHGSDIPYVFGYSPILGFDLSNGVELILNEWQDGTADHQMWLDMLGYFSRFAATGNPSPEEGVEWPAYDEKTDPYLSLDKMVSAGNNAAAKCDFWEGEDYLVDWFVE